MALRIRRSIKIAPGVRVNIGKKGLSTSIGGKGLAVNLSKKGTRVTAGLPGTGISASHLYKAPKRSSVPAQQKQHSEGEMLFSAGVIFFASCIVWWLATGFFAWLAAIIACCSALAFWAVKAEKSSAAKLLKGQGDAYWAAKARQLQEKHARNQPAQTQPTSVDSWQERVSKIEAARGHPNQDIQAGWVGLGVTTPKLVDYLGQAAIKLKEAKQAVKDGRYDDSWRLFHEVKELYAQHAQQSRFSAQQRLALDASVHGDMANQLRLQGRHRDAFMHALYSVMPITAASPKSHLQRVGVYFRRCKLKSTDLDEVEAFAATSDDGPDFISIQRRVADWFSREGKH